MAKLYIAEYLGIGFHRHPLGVPAAPAVVEQTPLVISGATAQSAAFGATTNLIGVSTDAICSINVGGPNPVATVNNFRLSADKILYFRVYPGDKIAVIANT